MKMKYMIPVLSVLFAVAQAQAKTLTVSCDSDRDDSVELISEISNVNTPQQIQSLEINEQKVGILKDVSRMPIYNNGKIDLRIAFGQSLYNTLTLSVEKCDDSFLATGSGTFSKYVGGFAGTHEYALKCTCSLK